MKINQDLKFRKVSKNDLKIIRDWRNSSGIWEYNNQFTFLNMKNQVQWLKSLKKSNKIMFIITNRKNTPIGICGLINIDKKNKHADVNIIIGKKALHGSGLGSIILYHLVKYGFTKLKLRRIGAEIFKFNNKSIKLFEKINFQREAILRENIWRGGRWWDIFLYSILFNEYKKLEKKN